MKQTDIDVMISADHCI